MLVKEKKKPNNAHCPLVICPSDKKKVASWMIQMKDVVLHHKFCEISTPNAQIVGCLGMATEITEPATIGKEKTNLNKHNARKINPSEVRMLRKK